MRSSSLCLAVVMLVSGVILGCKREGDGGSNSAAPPGGAGSASQANGGTATGSGAVVVTGHVAAYQNIHIEVPWDMNDPARTVATAQEAAAGKGLKLTDGTSTLAISSDGKTLRLNGRDYGTLHFGDHVVLRKDGKLTVNGVERQPESPTTATSKPAE